jgi:hypothetical protein
MAIVKLLLYVYLIYCLYEGTYNLFLKLKYFILNKLKNKKNQAEQK